MIVNFTVKKMIQRLQIKNFKSHKKTDIVFSPGVNIIVGESDSGKSAIIGALKWLITNRPVGDSFRSTWGGDTEVGIDIDDQFIVRFKSDKENKYISFDQQFHAIKTEVPEEVRSALNMNEVNLQTQFESHFLLSRSAGEVAQHFNKVAHLDKIDLGLQNVNRWIKASQGAINADTDHIKNAEEQLEDYEDINTIEDFVLDLEAWEREQGDLKRDVLTIQTYIAVVKNTDEEIEELEILEEMSDSVDEIIGYTVDIQKEKDKYYKLNALVLDVTLTESDIAKQEIRAGAGDAIDYALKIFEKIDHELLQLDKLEGLILWGEELEGEIDKVSIRLEILEEEFHENIGETCPLCDQIIQRK